MREKHKLSLAKDSVDSDLVKPSNAEDFRDETREHRELNLLKKGKKELTPPWETGWGTIEKRISAKLDFQIDSRVQAFMDVNNFFLSISLMTSIINKAQLMGTA